MTRCAAGGAGSQSSVVGSGSGHFIETGGPFELSVNARGEGAPPQGGGVQVYIEDNGKPQNGQPVDRVATEPPQPPASFDAAAGVCTDPR